jgi:HIRAN domain-containing protein
MWRWYSHAGGCSSKARAVGTDVRRLALVLVLVTAGTEGNAAERPTARIVVQDAPLAGFVYYDGRAVWDQMRKGDPLTIVREAANPHDENAIRIEWRGQVLGYVPRRDNADLARQLDRGARVDARITELTRSTNGRHRVSYEIYVPLIGK